MEEKVVTESIKQVDSSYGIVLKIPTGVVTPDMLRKIADVYEKYNCKVIKLTCAQRIAIIGIEEKDIEAVWRDLGVEPAAATGLCVRGVKVCPGKTFCKLGLQETMDLGLELEERYHGLVLPSKFKIAVSGCPNSCTEPAVKDLGFMGTRNGFTCFVGGSAGRRPRFADILAEGLSKEECLEIADKVVSAYKKNAKKGQRLGKFIESIGGIEEFKKLLE